MNEENLTTGIALLILLSAVFHASWNALLKKGNDKLLDILFAEILVLPFALVLIFFTPLPNPESWPFLLLSAGIHISYMYFLAKTYTSGDLSHAYVLLRGFSPFLIALGGHFLLGETLSSQSWFGITIISCGLLFIGWPASKDEFCIKTLTFILLTSLCIVSYTLIDGVGARLSGNSFSYMLWFGLLRAPFLLLWVSLAKRKEGFSYFCLNWKRSFLIFALSYLAYGIVLWAMTVAPIGLVSALRETSVVFAALIGVLIFKETAGRKRIVAAILVCIGTALIKM